MLRLGTRKLYYLLPVKNLFQEIKTGREGVVWLFKEWAYAS